jgi:hypothetical protein
MLLSAEQIKQLYKLLQEYPTTSHVGIRYETNGSGIGPSEFADYYEQKSFLNKPKLLGTVEITDVGVW